MLKGMRVTRKQVEGQIDYMNRCIGVPTDMYKRFKKDGKLVARPRHYFLEEVAGAKPKRYRLAQVVNKGGATRDVFGSCGTLREMLVVVTAFHCGVEDKMMGNI